MTDVNYENVKNDYPSAEKYHLMALEHSNANAMYNLIYLYEAKEKYEELFTLLVKNEKFDKDFVDVMQKCSTSLSFRRLWRYFRI